MGIKLARIYIKQKNKIQEQISILEDKFLVDWYINKHSQDSNYVLPNEPIDIPVVYLVEAQNELSERTEWATKLANYRNGIDTSYNYDSLVEKKNVYTDSLSEENLGEASFIVAQDTENLYIYIDQLIYLNKRIEQTQAQEDKTHDVQTTKEHIEVPDQTGHIYPVAFVAQITNKLIDYNNQLETFISDVKNYEKKIKAAIQKGPGKINLTWISKIVEKFCKRINYWLAVLRYQLIKGLSGVFKKFGEAIQPIKELYDMVMALLHIDLMTIVTGIINFAKSFLKIIVKPIEKYVTFIEDCIEYTPKLVDESTELETQVSDSIEYGTELYNEIQTTVSRTLSSGLDKDIIARLAEKYTDIGNVNFNIEFEAFTLSDLLNGEPTKPKWEDFK